MSKWIEITDPDDIEIDGEDINILYDWDESGNNYIYFKKDLLIELLNKENK